MYRQRPFRIPTARTQIASHGRFTSFALNLMPRRRGAAVSDRHGGRRRTVSHASLAPAPSDLYTFRLLQTLEVKDCARAGERCAPANAPGDSLF